MANPASQYCLKMGGKLERVRDAAGENHFCTLPDGQRIEQWTLYRQHHC
ncbi:putative hemolysin [Pantoea sp. C2G6]